MYVLGRITGPYGVQGWVRVHPFGDDPGSWRQMPQWWHSAEDKATAENWQPLALKAMRMHGKGLVAAFEGIADRNAAEALQGHYIGAPREALPATASDEYYWGELIGLQVENTTGIVLGKVEQLLSTGAHDVLQIDDNGLERLIPFVAAYVLEVDLAACRLVVDWNEDW